MLKNIKTINDAKFYFEYYNEVEKEKVYAKLFDQNIPHYDVLKLSNLKFYEFDELWYNFYLLKSNDLLSHYIYSDLSLDNIMTYLTHFKHKHINSSILFMTTISLEHKINLEFIFIEVEKVLKTVFKEKQLKMLERKFDSNLTLTEVGREYNLTRERVRQIEEKLIRYMNHYCSAYFSKLTQLIKFLRIIPLGKDISWLIHTFRHKKSKLEIFYDETLNSIIYNKDISYKKILDYIYQRLNDLRMFFCTEHELIDILLEKFDYINAKYILSILKDKELYYNDGKITFKNRYSKSEKRKCFNQYIKSLGEPIEINKRINKIKQDLVTYYPNVFQQDSSNRNITTMSDISEILLWDWGLHVHYSNVKDIIDSFSCDHLIEYLEEELKEKDLVSLSDYFMNNKMNLTQNGIISEHGLHTVLKFKYPDLFNYQDCPWIANKEVEGRIELSDYLIKELKDKDTLTLEEIEATLNTTSLRALQLVERCEKAIKVDNDKYKHIDNIVFDSTLINKLGRWIDNKIIELNIIHLNLVIDNFIEELNVFKDYNKEKIALDLITKYYNSEVYYINDGRFISIKYPKDLKQSTFSYFHFLTKKEIVHADEIYDFFLKRGWVNRQITLSLQVAYNNIYKRITHDTYILYEKIGIQDIEIYKIEDYISSELEYKKELEMEELIESENLPLINVNWTKYLLTDLLYSRFSFYPSSVNPFYIQKKQ